MLAGVQHHSSFFPHTYFDYETFYLVQCSSTVFGIRPIFEMREACGPVIHFSRFHERFWHLAYFPNTQRHVSRWYFFSFSRTLFAFVGFKSFLAFSPFSKCTKACDPIIHFSRFHERFWHLAHFRNAQRHVVRSYFFSFSCATSKKLSK